MSSHRALLEAMFKAAVDAAQPGLCLPPYLPPPPAGRTLVVGAGKAAAAMALAVEEHWPWPLEGLVVTRYGHGAPCRRIEVVEAGHPVPDSAGERAAAAILAKVGGLGPQDLVLLLISGGGSALMSLPAAGLTLADKQSVNRALLRSGAAIGEINCVRKHLSAIKGGRLALAAAPAPLVALIISDVPGDDLSIIASGPSVADATTRDSAQKILAKYGIEAPPAVVRHLADPQSETPKPGDPRLARVHNLLIATPQRALEAAAKLAAEAGYAPIILGDAIEGEAREVGIVHAGIAQHCASFGEPGKPPCVLLSGGETSVTMRGHGRGGRNAEFLLSLALALQGHRAITALAADTDGIDGSQDNAGAVITPDTLGRAATLGLDLRQMLANNDAYSAFARLGDLIMTGPTRTNVNDFRAIVIDCIDGQPQQAGKA